MCCADSEAEGKHCIDITIAYREENTNKPSTDCINKGLLFREVIVYSALSVLVIGFRICLCFVLFKYKTLSKKHLVTISQTRNALITLQIQPHETADRLYDIINDEDILDDRRIQQMLMSSNYLDVIHDSNTRELESNRCPNQDNPCQLLSIDQTQNQENNLKVDGHSLMSGDNTSSSDEYQWDSTQDYLNPYQPMIEISPPVENKYLTIATAHNRHDRGDGNYKDSTVVRNAYEPQHPRKMEKDAMANLHDNYKSSSISIGSNISKGVSNREGGKESKSYLNHTKI
ncbi:unnamed protein product [Mytilus edulis]|uniref:Uncharacterized protein n=1 Tax=Mytilus edulis TaxID=6550 RepID=A0A8S3S2X1_MYTED|nr:unnamed protein product [Mytilus edulis]